MYHKDLDLPGLCAEQRTKLRDLLPEPFTARQAVEAYLAAGGYWADVPLAYQALVCAGRLPDVGLVWKIARIAFRVQPDESGLRVWADTLGPENWQEARYATTTTTTTSSAAAASAAAHYAADAYAADAYAADEVRAEIIAMILAECERNGL